MSDNSIVTMEKHAITWSKVMSALIILAGALAIAVPPAAGIAATLLIGWLLVFAGAAHFAFGWHTRAMGGLVWGILLGLAYLIAGIYILIHPVAGLAVLTLGLGAYLFAEAILEFALAWKMRPIGGSGWLFFDAVVTLFFSILIWRTWPANSAWIIGTVIGVSMVFSGVSRLGVLAAAKHLHSQSA